MSAPATPQGARHAGDEAAPSDLAAGLEQMLRTHSATVGVIGLGYVGLPLWHATASAGFQSIGFDVDTEKIDALRHGKSYISHIPDETLRDVMQGGRTSATADFGQLGHADVVLICVPTPLTRHREPDLAYVESTAQTLAKHLRPGQLVVLESTTYPGTTAEVLRPILEAGGLKSGTDFFLAYSPEREDPGNAEFDVIRTPKIVGADGAEALGLAKTFYEQFVQQVVPVSSMDTAEAVKLTENIFRSVNIALVNELKIVFDAMGVDIWEVIDAARTKPFGFMPFYPGPGLGGHCIPIDPFYLTWKAREYGIATRFIELAGEVNTAMPVRIAERLGQALNDHAGKALKNARILLVGVAYKKNVADMRESPALRIFELLEGRGARVDFHDPFVPEIPPTREHGALTGRRSVGWNADTISACDAALICTDHDAVDYALLVEGAALVVDTRNVIARLGLGGSHVVKA